LGSSRRHVAATMAPSQPRRPVSRPDPSPRPSYGPGTAVNPRRAEEIDRAPRIAGPPIRKIQVGAGPEKHAPPPHAGNDDAGRAASRDHGRGESDASGTGPAGRRRTDRRRRRSDTADPRTASSCTGIFSQIRPHSGAIVVALVKIRGGHVPTSTSSSCGGEAAHDGDAADHPQHRCCECGVQTFLDARDRLLGDINAVRRGRAGRRIGRC
jgi:hypothetical protein